MEILAPGARPSTPGPKLAIDARLFSGPVPPALMIEALDLVDGAGLMLASAISPGKLVDGRWLYELKASDRAPLAGPPADVESAPDADAHYANLKARIAGGAA